MMMTRTTVISNSDDNNDHDYDPMTKIMIPKMKTMMTMMKPTMMIKMLMIQRG